MHFRWLAVAVLSLCPLRALADNNDLFGLGPRAAAMGGAMVAESNDFSSAFYNPSLLVNSKDSNFGLSLQFYRPTASVEKVSGAADLDCTNCTPRDVVASSLGFVFPLGGKVKNRVAIGLAVTLPTSVFLRLSSPDRNLPYWYRYDSSPERFIVHVAAGIKLVDWLNVGIGVQSLSDLIGDGVSVKVDLFSKQVRTGQINSYLSTRIGPVFGLTLTPWKRLRLGASFRWEMKLEYQIPAKVDLEGIGALNLTIGGVTHYTPHTFQFGGSLDVLDNLTVTLDGEWMNWSAAPSPYMNVGIARRERSCRRSGSTKRSTFSRSNRRPASVTP